MKRALLAAASVAAVALALGACHPRVATVAYVPPGLAPAPVVVAHPVYVAPPVVVVHHYGYYAPRPVYRPTVVVRRTYVYRRR